MRRAAADGLIEFASTVDFAAVSRHRERVVAEIAQDERDERFTQRGIEVIHGAARFTGAHQLVVGERMLTAKRFVVATGSDPAVPPVDGIEDVPYLTNRTIFDLAALPERLVVLGGGAIGVELAQAFARFGSTVTVVEMADRLLMRDEPEAGEVIANALRADGVDVRLGVTAEHVSATDGEITVRLAAGAVSGDALLVAAGRRGHTDGFGLEQLGIEVDKGYIVVDEHCRTSLGHVYAAGDVTGGLQFTHVASHEGTVAGRNAAGKRAKTDERVTPWVTFTDPEVAHVGLTEAEARKKHDHVEVQTFPMSGVDRARIIGRPAGFVKLVTASRAFLGRAGGGELVGAQIVGPRAGELIHECVLAMKTRAFAGRLTQAIHAYPTMSIAVQQAEAQFFPLGRVLAERER